MENKKKQITLVPVGGLANRMRAVHATVALARKLDAEVKVIWFKGWELNCPFNQLFMPFDDPRLILKEATFWDHVIYDRPRKRNAFIPKIFQKIIFDKTMYENEAGERYLSGYDFSAWFDKKRHYLATFSEYYQDKGERKFEMFRPTEELMERVRQNTRLFHAHTVGVHIRRTDNVASTTQSPTALFVQRMEEEVKNHPDTLFYLATDSEEEKSRLKGIFGESIITSANEADRNSIQGMQDAVVEFYTLASTSHIIGSFGSSFATAAAQAGGIGYENVSLNQKKS